VVVDDSEIKVPDETKDELALDTGTGVTMTFVVMTTAPISEAELLTGLDVEDN
jgi:hypothetical protein